MNQALVTRISTTAAVEKTKASMICTCQNCCLGLAKPGRGTSAWQKAWVTLAALYGSLENILFSFLSPKTQKGMLQWIGKV